SFDLQRLESDVVIMRDLPGFDDLETSQHYHFHRQPTTPILSSRPMTPQVPAIPITTPLAVRNHESPPPLPPLSIPARYSPEEENAFRSAQPVKYKPDKSLPPLPTVHGIL
ncbi:hypothetical protein IWQ60_012487, partial [Tieghemiomyces parasiticus]